MRETAGRFAPPSQANLSSFQIATSVRCVQRTSCPRSPFLPCEGRLVRSVTSVSTALLSRGEFTLFSRRSELPRPIMPVSIAAEAASFHRDELRWRGVSNEQSRRLFAVLGLVLAALVLIAVHPGSSRTRAPAIPRFLSGAPPCRFTAVRNAGQIDARVRFYAQGAGFVFYLTAQEAVFQFARKASGRAGSRRSRGEANPQAPCSAYGL